MEPTRNVTKSLRHDGCANAAESSIAVKDAVENCGLLRVFALCLCSRVFRHYGTTIARLSPARSLERGRLRTRTCAWKRDRAR